MSPKLTPDDAEVPSQNEERGADGPDAKAASSRSVPATCQSNVGGGQPPLKSRFKPGRSGNPVGRPPGQISLIKAAEKAFSQKLNYKCEGKTRRASMLEALLDVHGRKGVQGNVRSAELALKFAAKFLPTQQIESLDDATSSRLAEPSCLLFTNLDENRLSSYEKIELSRLAAMIDRGGIFALSDADFALARRLCCKGQGTGVSPANDGDSLDPS